MFDITKKELIATFRYFDYLSELKCRRTARDGPFHKIIVSYDLSDCPPVGSILALYLPDFKMDLQIFTSTQESSDVRTLIDGFAKFVAKNGIEFESLAKEKHKDNPQFSFLFGGSHFHYYQQRLNEAKLAQKSDPDPPNELEPQDPIVSEFEETIKPVISQCTKDSISSGKSWIFSHFRTQAEYVHLSQLLLSKTTPLPGVSFFDRLHIVYLINDVLHHCIRKNNQELRRAIQQQIPQIFSNCSKDATKENLKKLDKLVKIWRSQTYFDEGVLISLDFIISQRESELSNEISLPKNEPPNQILPASHNPIQPHDPTHIPPQTHQPPPLLNRPPHPTNHPPHFRFSSHPSTPHRLPFLSGGDGQERIRLPPQVFNPYQNRFRYIPQHPIQQPLPIRPGFDMPRHPNFPLDKMQSWPQHRPPYTFNQPEQFAHRPPMSAAPREPFGAPNSYPPPGNRFPIIESEHPDYGFVKMEQENEQLEMPDVPIHFSSPNYPPIQPPVHPTHDNTPNYSGGSEDYFPAEKFSPHNYNQEENMPDPISIDNIEMPYYDLPAGLMALLVPLEEHDYTPLDPSLIRLPPPQQPSQRLLKAVENFYEPPSEDNPRNKRGWEAKALIDYFEAKRMSILKRGNIRRSVSTEDAKRYHGHSGFYEKERHSSKSSKSSRSSSRNQSVSTENSESSHSSYSPSPSRSPSRDRPPVSTYEAYPDHSHNIYREREEVEVGGGLGFSSHSFNQQPDSEVGSYDDRYAGVGSDALPSDIYEQYRRSKSYTYNRKPPSSKRVGYGKTRK